MKTVNMRFLNIMLCYYFSLEADSQGVAKCNPTKKKLMQKFRRLSSLRERENPQKMQSLSLEIAKVDLNYKLQLLASKFQKESPGSVLEKGVLKNFVSLHRKKPVQKFLF